MHVTHVVAHPPFREGTGTVCYYNARALRDLGCEVIVYAPRWRLHGEEGQFEFYRFMPCWLAVGNAYLTPHLLALGPTDLVHLHYPFILGSELVLLRVLMTGVPFVLTYHNDLIAGGVRRPIFFIYNRLLAPLIIAHAQKIVVTSLDYADSSIYGASIFKTRQADLVEVANGVETDVFKPDVDGNRVRIRHDIQPGEVVLLFVSSLDRSHARKGLSLMLHALTQLSDKPYKLLVVGGGDMRYTYEQQAHVLGLETRVIFAGRVPQADLPSYYAACDMVTIPSRPPEAFGVALAQGMATGRPVIGSNIPGVRTLIKDGETGLLIPPEDSTALATCIDQLGRAPELRQELGKRGRQRIVEHYTWRRSGERLLGLYQSILHQIAGD